MLNYAICEVSGKQYKVIPNKAFEVSLQKDSGDIEANILFISEDNNVKIGNPYLKEKLTLKRLEDTKGAKIRVSKFHAKANFRKTIGFRPKFTKVILAVEKSS